MMTVYGCSGGDRDDARSVRVGSAALDVDSTSGSGTLLARPVARKNPWKNPRLIAAGGVLLAIVTFLIFNAMGSSMAYFHTVSELRATTAEPGGACDWVARSCRARWSAWR